MNERETRETFSSKLLVPLAGEQPGETVLSNPGYVFLGCPFDVPSASRALAGWRGSTSPKWEIFWVTTAIASPIMGLPESSSIAGSRTCSGRGRPKAPRNPAPGGWGCKNMGAPFEYRVQFWETFRRGYKGACR
jgi:hypothetical protein